MVLEKLVVKSRLILTGGLGLETRNLRHECVNRGAKLTYVSIACGRFQHNQWLVRLYEIAFPDQDLTDDAAFQMLHVLDLARRRYLASRYTHDVEFAKCDPNTKSKDKRQANEKNARVTALTVSSASKTSLSGSPSITPQPFLYHSCRLPTAVSPRSHRPVQFARSTIRR